MTVRRLLFAAALLAPGCAAAGEFGAYRIPEHTWRSGSAALSGRYDRESFTTDSPGSSAEKRKDGAAGLWLSFENGFDSDRLQHSWRAYASGSVSGATEEAQDLNWEGAPHTRDYWTRRNVGTIQVSGNLRAYPGGRDLGMDLSAGLLAAASQDLYRRDDAYDYVLPDLRYEYRDDDQRNRYDYAGNATITLGHGIVRDATVVEDVHVLEQRLLAAGTLARELSPAGRERLAALLTVTPTLSYQHDRPERFEWREVERVLREDGALAGESLDAYGLLRATEPYLSVPSRRRIGHFAGLAAMFEHRHGIHREALKRTSRLYVADSLAQESIFTGDASDDDYRDRAYVGVVAEWHRPSGWRVQWDAFASALVPARPGEVGLVERVDLTAEWHVADRWQVTGGFRQERDYLEEGDRDDSTPHDDWRTNLVGALDYYVEDNLSLRLAVTDQQVRSRQVTGVLGAGVLYDRYVHSGGVQLGISYRFLGRVAAPGLFDGLTPLQ